MTLKGLAVPTYATLGLRYGSPLAYKASSGSPVALGASTGCLEPMSVRSHVLSLLHELPSLPELPRGAELREASHGRREVGGGWPPELHYCEEAHGRKQYT